MSGISKAVLGVGLGAVTLTAGLAAVGTWRTTHVLTVSRPTTASPQAIWDLWADVANRTRWDDGLEAARIDGPFHQGPAVRSSCGTSRHGGSRSSRSRLKGQIC
jgi:hypothetical protein